jgi:hypothetical protein
LPGALKVTPAISRPAFDVFADEDVQLALASRTAGGKVQPRILLHVAERDELNGMPFRDGDGNLRDVATGGAWHDLNRRIARDVNRIVSAELVRLPSVFIRAAPLRPIRLVSRSCVSKRIGSSPARRMMRP